jgi:hypothetical protein
LKNAENFDVLIDSKNIENFEKCCAGTWPKLGAAGGFEPWLSLASSLELACNRKIAPTKKQGSGAVNP